ncbi:unnamed protein product [Fusarium graminearum]|nr:unnamed protein product [Fusarium graminearum]
MYELSIKLGDFETPSPYEGELSVKLQVSTSGHGYELTTTVLILAFAMWIFLSSRTLGERTFRFSTLSIVLS